MQQAKEQPLHKPKTRPLEESSNPELCLVTAFGSLEMTLQ